MSEFPRFSSGMESMLRGSSFTGKGELDAGVRFLFLVLLSTDCSKTKKQQQQQKDKVKNRLDTSNLNVTTSSNKLLRKQ